ncbi:hypothetical protein NHX12_020902 [Muraenolepis orangiensis]|uniref:Uncharacterized protein n=1 Tax=Muraenolepis orangiensis TaxID=630683 RepID=A0A9Q0EVR4_9TELE|nr:hypothetical protein NHX12_020902 [Muraenolepis orangiensis]
MWVGCSRIQRRRGPEGGDALSPAQQTVSQRIVHGDPVSLSTENIQQPKTVGTDPQAAPLTDQPTTQPTNGLKNHNPNPTNLNPPLIPNTEIPTDLPVSRTIPRPLQTPSRPRVSPPDPSRPVSPPQTPPGPVSPPPDPPRPRVLPPRPSPP